MESRVRVLVLLLQVLLLLLLFVLCTYLHVWRYCSFMALLLLSNRIIIHLKSGLSLCFHVVSTASLERQAYCYAAFAHTQIQSSKQYLAYHKSVSLWVHCIDHVIYILCSDWTRVFWHSRQSRHEEVINFQRLFHGYRLAFCGWLFQKWHLSR